ncbi:MAG: helix-turn-helix transcriptional regulator, partial [Muribaculaceae bacterium]|nr:helix-turn-helix transcriptional regulator [Muribaculaceae bacterium]
AMAKRARAQILYKLWQPERALEELQPASRYIARPLRSGPEFATAASIDEWLWIISRSLGDTAGMNRVGKDYARLVEEVFSHNSRIDTTGHFPVTAIAFRGEALFTSGDTLAARTLLSQADTLMLTDLPARAYEHLFEVRASVRAADNDLTGALADVDTLLSTHQNFPRFYLNDLLLKARILEQARRHEESAAVYSRYIAMHDSISSRITDQRLQNLSVLYRSEIDREQRRAHTTRMFALASVIILLLILLLLSLLHAVNVRRKNLRLVERLKEFDRATATSLHSTDNETQNEPSLIDRLDRHMATDRPYTNPGLSRRELAEFAGISQDALGTLIKAEKGCSVKSYINSFRLDEARRLLESDASEPIATIATRLGFGTPRTLQRAFKERFDMSPSQYREAISKI